MSRLQERSSGMVCRTIDSLLGKFCYYCGATSQAVRNKTDNGLDFCICPVCAEAKRLDDIDEKKERETEAQYPAFLRQLAEKLERHSMDIYGSDIEGLRTIAYKLEQDSLVQQE